MPTGDKIEGRLALAIAETVRALQVLTPILNETGPGMIGPERYKRLQTAMLQLGTAEIALNRATNEARAAFNLFAAVIAQNEPAR
jgi:hypothetical protein